MTIIRCLDLETTGFDPTDSVVEVATLDIVRDEAGAVTLGKAWSTLINPSVPIPPQASAVHHILNCDVEDAPLWDDVIPTLMDGPPVAFVAHNAKFERQFFDAGNIKWIDTYRVALKLWFDAPSHSCQALRYYLDLPVPRDTPAHRAAGDTLVTAHILLAAFAKGVTASEMVKITNEPAVLPRLHFGKWAGKPFAEIDGGYLSWMLKQSDMDDDAKHTAFVEMTRRREKAKA
jgi:exodeoxyribonuclease X